MHGTLTGCSTPGQSRPGSNRIERVLQTSESFTIECLMSYIRTLIGGGGGGSYSSAEIQSAYSMIPADWVDFAFVEELK